ncbi:MAG: PfkB family carbohydrate kinase [Proteobacteria bacterium]|nr:PfkB family carbohydrate kinase [Pseudomonadota bacterium]
MRRIAVIGHVEHVTIAPVAALPAVGQIAHLAGARAFAGGGGGVAFAQLARGLGAGLEVLLFTAVGDDEAGRFVLASVTATGARVFAAPRREPHTRDLVVVTPDAQRTIFVIGEPLHPRLADPLPWDLLATCDAVYFTARDPEVLRAARAARIVVASARRRDALARSGIRVDVIVGSIDDPREASRRADYAMAPDAVVMTDGARGGTVERADGIARWSPTPAPPIVVGSYGAGDSFAGALTGYLATGATPLAAAARAAVHGAAVLAGLVPLDHQQPLELSA